VHLEVGIPLEPGDLEERGSLADGQSGFGATIRPCSPVAVDHGREIFVARPRAQWASQVGALLRVQA
jgi:hypothetical protein